MMARQLRLPFKKKKKIRQTAVVSAEKWLRRNAERNGIIAAEIDRCKVALGMAKAK